MFFSSPSFPAFPQGAWRRPHGQPHYWGYIGIMEKKMETTIMENQMETKMENDMETVII